jgi:hypothetical protein
MLDAVLDLRPTIEKATDEELAEIFKAFDVRITYDKNRQALDFAATITSELMPNENDRPEGRSRVSDIAGAGLKRKPATEVRALAAWDLAGKRWLHEGFW